MHRPMPEIAAASAGVMFWLVLASCGAAEDRQEAAQAVEVATRGSGAGAGPAAPGLGSENEEGENESERADRDIFEATIQRAQAARLDTLSIGDRVVALGRWFVGAPYTPQTLESSPEHLVVNLREFDCVTTSRACWRSRAS